MASHSAHLSTFERIFEQPGQLEGQRGSLPTASFAIGATRDRLAALSDCALLPNGTCCLAASLAGTAEWGAPLESSSAPPPRACVPLDALPNLGGGDSVATSLTAYRRSPYALAADEAARPRGG